MMQFIKDQDPKKQINLSLLPPEIYSEILLHLQIIDLIPLRLVCKSWDKFILKIMELKSREYTKYEPGYLINFGLEYPWHQQIKLKKLIDTNDEKGLQKALSHPHTVISKNLFLYSEDKNDGLHKLIEEKTMSLHQMISQIHSGANIESILYKHLNLFDNSDFPELAYLLLYKILLKNITNKDHLLNILVQSKISLKISQDNYHHTIRDILIDLSGNDDSKKNQGTYNAAFVLKFMHKLVKADQKRLDDLLFYYIYETSCIDFLVKLGADVNSICLGQDSVLCHAIKSKPAHVEQLLSLGADPNKLSADNSPLFHSIFNANNYEMAEILIKHGAKISKIEKNTLLYQYKFKKTQINIEELEAKHGDLCVNPLEQPSPQKAKWCWML